jgi:hypothetical protein
MVKAIQEEYYIFPFRLGIKILIAEYSLSETEKLEFRE